MMMIMISVTVLEAKTRINIGYDKIVSENPKKRGGDENQTKFVHEFSRIHSLLRNADTRGSADIMYLI